MKKNLGAIKDDIPEVWKPIPKHDGYEASSLGRIRSVDRVLADGRSWSGKIMKPKISRGYAVLALSLGSKGNYRHCGVHVLVAEAFHGERPSTQYQIAHGDGDPMNNCPSNLRWATALENAQDRDRHGRTAKPKGSAHGMSKLTEQTVIEMRKLKQQGLTVDDLAAQFSISRWTVFDAISGRTWGHI